mgnify:CR=1 FL=1
MTSAQIEAFLAVCEQKSVSRAAEKLFVSQPSLSTKIKTLERELGFSLFVRRKGSTSVSLTAQGKEFYLLAIQHQEIVRAMFALRTPSGGKSLRISTSNSIGTYLFAPVYARFMKKNPEISLEVREQDTDSAYLSLRAGVTDLAFTPGQRDSSLVTVQPMFSESMLFVCTSDASYPPQLSVSQLRVCDEVYVDWSSNFVQWHDRVFGFHAEPRIRLSIMSQLHFFMLQPQSWAIVPYSVAQGLIAAGGVVSRQLQEAPPERLTNCNAREGLDPALVGAFLACLREQLAQMQTDKIQSYL